LIECCGRQQARANELGYYKASKPKEDLIQFEECIRAIDLILL
jgi:hypothetical protein